MGDDPPPEPIYFEGPVALRDWLDANHATATELWVGYHKKATGRPSLTWSEAVDEALCVGWIDGVRYSVDEERFRQRLTPRRKGSTWSAVNVAKVAQLTAEGRMRPAGLAAFEARRDDRTAVYSYERRHEAALEPDEEARFRANHAAWTWFGRQRPSYRTTATYWVVSAKRPETRARRLDELIDESAAGRTPKQLTPPGRLPDGSPAR
jgi:uncharacterized protein YdeI (YjbR/CyaY-like superfamily)